MGTYYKRLNDFTLSDIRAAAVMISFPSGAPGSAKSRRAREALKRIDCNWNLVDGGQMFASRSTDKIADPVIDITNTT